MWMINKENSRDLNFSLACIYCQAIDIEEFKKWIEIVIKETSIDELPNYIFDLVDFNEPLFHITNVIGFVPSNNLSKKDEYAIYGITYLRKKDVYDPPVSKEKALTALKKNPQIMKEFKRFFPFVKFESE